MARKKSGAPNKSEAIRDYYAAHPDAKPKQVVAALQKKRITVSAGFVSTIRSKSKENATVGKPGRPPGTKTVRRGRPAGRGDSSPAASLEYSIDSLLKVKRIVNEMGGFGETRNALSALEKLLN